MALSLGLARNRGVYFNDTLMTVERIVSGKLFYVRVHGACIDKEFEITDKEAIEVCPQVRISAGLDGTNELARLVINAPRSITILRDTLYNKQKKQNG